MMLFHNNDVFQGSFNRTGDLLKNADLKLH